VKIGLSKKVKGEPRHITLIITRAEHYDIRTAIVHDVLKGQYSPVREPFTVRTPQGIEYMMRYRFHMKHLDDLMLTFPHADFSPGLESHMKEETKAILNSIKTPKFEIPDFHGDLRRFQKVSVWRILRKMYPDYPQKKKGGSWKSEEKPLYHYLNDEMGLGKTVQALAVIAGMKAQKKGRKRKTLVVVPGSVKHNWRKEILKFTDLVPMVVHGTLQERREQLRTEHWDVAIINPEMLRVRQSFDEDQVPGALRSRVRSCDPGRVPPLQEPEGPADDRFAQAAVVPQDGHVGNPSAQRQAGRGVDLPALDVSEEVPRLRHLREAARREERLESR
jgi:hypothetical protein